MTKTSDSNTTTTPQMTIEQANKMAQVANRLANLLQLWEQLNGLNKSLKAEASSASHQQSLLLLASLCSDINNAKIELDSLEGGQKEKDA